jgi:[acyl-carrier-protein] S-malonyltransferase
MKTAFIFPGQGSQYPGMFKDIYENSRAAKRIFDLCDDALRRQISALCFNGTQEELNLTQNTQPCVLACDLAAAAALEERGIRPEGTAGFSLGEYAAMAQAKVLSEEDSFHIVQLRADAMQEAVLPGEGAMTAIIGLDPHIVEEICRKAENYVIPANYNSPVQITISGTRDGVEEAAMQACKMGGRAWPLPVSAPFHCQLMKPALGKLEPMLSTVNMMKPSIPVYFNYTGRSADLNMKDLLLRQVYSPVQWIKTIEAMYKDGFDTFIECGPGKTLSGFVKKILREKGVSVLNVENKKTLDDVCKKLGVL